MIIYSEPEIPTSIPVVDLSDSFSARLEDRLRVARAIHKALREIGFFYAANHGVPQSLIDAQFDAARALFALPLEEKMALHMKHSPASAGYEPIGGQILDSQDADAEVAPPDLKESFYCNMELPPDHPMVKPGRRSYGFNQWPASLPAFKPQQVAYSEALTRLADRLVSLVALSLELPEDYFARFYRTPAFTLRLIKYPPHPSIAKFNQLGAGAHTDWGAITMLAQDDLGGLEVRNAAGTWLQATPIAGTFVINIGDLTQRWTNDVYRSNMHRVKNNNVAGRDRYSIPFFYGPEPDTPIECLPTCTDASHPPRYATVSAQQHLNEMFRRSYGYAPDQRPVADAP